MVFQYIKRSSSENVYGSFLTVKLPCSSSLWEALPRLKSYVAVVGLHLFVLYLFGKRFKSSRFHWIGSLDQTLLTGVFLFSTQIRGWEHNFYVVDFKKNGWVSLHCNVSTLGIYINGEGRTGHLNLQAEAGYKRLFFPEWPGGSNSLKRCWTLR